MAASRLNCGRRPAPEQRNEQRDEQRVVTGAPGTVGLNLDVLRPYVFAPSIISRLGVEMPMVPTGTYATGTLSGAASADAVAKGADVPETAGSFTVQQATPKRIGASLNLAIEDIAAVGQANFESLLREHISLVISDELDDQALNGDGQNDDLIGFFMRLGRSHGPGGGSGLRCLRGGPCRRYRWPMGQYLDGGRDPGRTGHHAALGPHVPDCGQLQGRAQCRRLRRENERRLVDQQADARCGH